MIYAQLNSENVCIGYSNLSGNVSSPSLVFLPNGWDDDLLFRTWNNGWSEDKIEVVTQGTSINDEIEQLKAQNAEIIFALVMNDLM